MVKLSRYHFKRVISSVLACAMSATILPYFPVNAEETVEKYPYTMFAASDAEGAITVNAGNFCVNGSIATNGTIVASGNMNINGTRTEQANEKMVYIFDKIDVQYFSGSNVEAYTEDYTLEEMNININNPLEVEGDATLTGNINISSALKAFENVELYGEVKNTNESVICSEMGSIIIDSTNVNLNGLVYAPFGAVVITAQNLNLNNVIIIADSITFNCPSVNANYSNSIAEFVGYSPVEIPSIDDVDMTDSDSDGIPDSFEEQYGTDPANSDSDGDGLPDGYELFILSYDPTKIDSDNNGITDGDEDFDSDGLTNIEEFLLGTYPQISDSDMDGISDWDEVNVYGSDPLLIDTDGDGINDGDELLLGFDPTNPQTFGVADLEYVTEQNINSESYLFNAINADESDYKLSMSIKCSGLAEDAIIVEESALNNTLNNELYIGDVIQVDFNDGCTVQQMTLNFKINEEHISNTEYEEVSKEFVGLHRFNVFRYFDELGMIFPIETIVDDEINTVSATVTDAGSYCVIDMVSWLRNLGISVDELNEETIAEELNSVALYSTNSAIDYEEDLVELEGLPSVKSQAEEYILFTDENIATLALDEESSENESSVVFTEEKCDSVDVVFSINCAGNNMEDYIEYVKEQILVAGEEIFEMSRSARICIICYTNNDDRSYWNYATHLTAYNGSEWATSMIQLKSMVKKIELNKNTVASLLEAGLVDVAFPYYAGHQLSMRKNAEKFCFQFLGFGGASNILFNHMDPNRYDSYFGNYNYLFNHMSQNQVNYSCIMDSWSNSPVYNFIAPYAFSLGGYVDALDNGAMTENIVNHIYKSTDKIVYSFGSGNGSGYVPKPPVIKTYNALVLDGMKEITLDDAITDDYKVAARKYDEEDHSEYSSYADTDEDGLYDFLEVKMLSGLISFDEDGNAVLPTFDDCKEFLEEEYFYVENGLQRYCDSLNHDYSTLDFILSVMPVLPINSDPTNEDSDGDTLADTIDNDPLREIGNVSKCWLYHNDYKEIYLALFGEEDYNSYDNTDASNHSPIPILDEDESGNECTKFVCICCNNYTVISPDEQDRNNLSMEDYLIVRTLQCIYAENINKPDTNYLSAEAAYHLIDIIRRERANRAYAYEFQSNSRCCSPISYKLSDEEIKNSIVDVTVTRHTAADDFFDNMAMANLSFITGLHPLLTVAYTGINTAYEIYKDEDILTMIENNESGLIATGVDIMIDKKLNATQYHVDNVSNALTLLMFLNSTNDLLQNIESTPRFMYNITITIQNGENKEQYFASYAFDDFDNILINLTENTVPFTVNNPDSYNKYSIQWNNLYGDGNFTRINGSLVA